MLLLVPYREKLPGEVVGLLSAISGIFGACLRDAHQFEFGSSRSSQVKDQTINNLSGASLGGYQNAEASGSSSSCW
jgi:hypothetical protein